jgi:nucleotide-binding universal stress UspA family protein
VHAANALAPPRVRRYRRGDETLGSRAEGVPAEVAAQSGNACGMRLIVCREHRRPADVLEAVVRETDATLLVLGGKHHSKLGRWLGGSTVQHVVRRLTVPLLVTAGEIRPHPRVMVAVDPSYAALPTARVAVAFARLLGSPLRALHVIDPPPAIAELPRDWSREIIERDVWPTIPLVEQGKVIREGVPFD